MTMNETSAVKGSVWTELMSGLSGGDKGFVVLLLSMIGAYGLKRYFDNVERAMDRGYNTTLKAEKYGEVRFTRGTEEETDVENESIEQSSDEDAVSDGYSGAGV